MVPDSSITSKPIFPRFPTHRVVSGDCFGIAAEGFRPRMFSSPWPFLCVLSNLCCLHSGRVAAAEREKSLPGWEPGPCGKQKGLSCKDHSQGLKSTPSPPSPTPPPTPPDEVRVPGLRRRTLRTQGPVNPGPELCGLGVSTRRGGTP